MIDEYRSRSTATLSALGRETWALGVSPLVAGKLRLIYTSALRLAMAAYLAQSRGSSQARKRAFRNIWSEADRTNRAVRVWSIRRRQSPPKIFDLIGFTIQRLILIRRATNAMSEKYQKVNTMPSGSGASRARTIKTKSAVARQGMMEPAITIGWKENRSAIRPIR